MKVIIEISEKLFNAVKEACEDGFCGSDVWESVASGVPYNSTNATDERPQGEWLEMKRKIDDRHSVFIFKCPFCGYIEKCKANFCGKCGAEMKMRTTAD